MDLMAAVLPWVSVAIVLLVAVAVHIRSRNRVWLRDAWLMLVAQPRVSAILGVILIVASLGSILLGVGLLHAGFAFGWGFFPLAAGQLLVVGFYVWIARRSFDETDGSE